MSRQTNEGPPRYTPSSDEERILLARYAMALIKWRWFPGCEVVRKRDEQMLMPPLLFGLYVARRRKKLITKGEACDLMGVDRSTTGPKFIRALVDEGLAEVNSYPEIDRRKDFVTGTAKLDRLVETELVRLARSLKDLVDDLMTLESVVGIDWDEATRAPSGGPAASNLLPVDWPPDEVGVPFVAGTAKGEKNS